MILTDQAARGGWTWAPYFVPAEFECRHCGRLTVDTRFLNSLAAFRKALDRPMYVTSGYRCAEHNAAVSGTGATGPHTTGSAADIGVFGEDAYRLVQIAISGGATGIGVQQTGDLAKRFVHLDTLTAPNHPRPRVWSYPRAA